MGYLSLQELPPAPQGRRGWPWTEHSASAPAIVPGGSAWPRISIVTPSLNQAQFLEQTIRSVLLQGYPNLEYIIIDGGSTDGSVEIIRKYEQWLAYWVSEPDRGQSHAINKGWERATGEILAWLNSDDYYAPAALTSAATHFRTAPSNTGMVHGRVFWVDAAGNYVPSLGKPFLLAETLRNADTAVGQQAAFLRADLVQRLGGLREQFHMAMDWDLFIRVALENRTVFVPEVWAFANDWAGTKTRSPVLGFGPDMLESTRCLYRRKDLPANVLAVKDEALALIGAWAARDHYRARRYFRMQVCFWVALAHCPAKALSLVGSYLGIRIALGPLFPVVSAFRKRLRVLGI